MDQSSRGHDREASPQRRGSRTVVPFPQIISSIEEKDRCSKDNSHFDICQEPSLSPISLNCPIKPKTEDVISGVLHITEKGWKNRLPLKFFSELADSR